MPQFLSAWCVWSVVHLVILLALTKDYAEAQQIRSVNGNGRPATSGTNEGPVRPLLPLSPQNQLAGPCEIYQGSLSVPDESTPEFRRHSPATATVHHGRSKRELAHTKDSDGLHHPDIIATVEADGQPYVLELTLTRHLIPVGHTIHYREAGVRRTHTPSKEEMNFCQYSGVVRDRPGSWAAVSTCHGLRGVFYDGRMLRYIEPSGHDLSSPHRVYSHADLQVEKRCGTLGGVTKNASFDEELFHRYHKQRAMEKVKNRYKRGTDEAHQVRGPSGANQQSRYLELVLVADHAEYLAAGSLAAVHHQMKDVANIINALYAPLNVFIALVGVVVWTDRDEIPLLEDGDQTLTSFLQYRQQSIIPHISNDNAQLITRKVFKCGVVGKALKGPICTYKQSGGVNRNHSTVIGLVAATIAHEMGHNFGLEHDDPDVCTCPEDKCVMYPSSTTFVPVHWSSCSLRSLALAFDRGMDYCLRNKPKSLFGSPTCGNGFVEPGEQCDCGVALDAHRSACTACCRPDCTLRPNATCATGACCDMTTCRPRVAGTVCRSADQECDLPEFCSGHSEYCPADVFKMDATPCGPKLETYCVRGSCRSHDDQCRLLWGATGEMSMSKCYNFNTKGNLNGNCGLDRVRQTYKACQQEDVLCGMLHCRHLNEQLEFGLEGASLSSQSFLTNNGTIVVCRTSLVDLGLEQVDPGLAPDGASCGVDKMCMSQKCVTVESVLRVVRAKETSVCPSNCSGHGVCNSEGHCHCEPGFAPPLCALPGPGGSYESGPASDPSLQRKFMVAMYIIFLGIIPSILLFLFLIYYSRHNVLMWWQKPKKSIQSPKKTSLQRRISRSASKFAGNFHGSNSNGTAPPVNVHTLSSPDDMSSSLLRSDSDRSPSGNINPSVNFFGNFKGFSLTPVEKNQSTQSADAAILSARAEPKTAGKVEAIHVNKSAKITPVHRTGSNVQTLVSQGVLKPVLRSAPPLPVVPASVKSSSPKTSPSIKRANSSVQNKIKALMNADKQEDLHSVVVNPPPRPVISSPILEASTCTAKELISPLQGSKTLGPIRAAPTVPGETPELPKRPLSMHGNVLQKPLPEEPKKVKEGISLNRIASFLKQEKPKEKERKPVERSHSLPKNPNHLVRVPKTVDKVALRNLQISGPILQKEIELTINTVPVVSDSEDGDDAKAFVNRTQSMRGPAVTPKPLIQSFGSMRQAPGAPRPVSVVGRPTAPPPPLPNQPKDKPSSIYQNPKSLTELGATDYVDCIEEKQVPLAHIDEESGDNIYAIIEESPEKHSKPLPGVPPPVKTTPQAPPEGYNAPKPTKPVGTNSGSSESVGLLGEIVNEIQNRNFDSIYSASTLKRKKEKEKALAEGDRDSTYMNTDYKTPESVYSNSGAKSTVSTTSSGYLHPSAVNVPTFMKNDSNQDEHSGDSQQTPPSPTMKVNSKIPMFGRQVTPPILKNTSTFRTVPSSPKNVPKNVAAKSITANSPDVVSSCAVPEVKSAKPPDVINNNKLQNEAPKVAAKPSITTKVNDNARPQLKLPTNEKKVTGVKPTPVLKPVNSSSNLKTDIKNPALKNVTSKVDSNVKAIADNLNKNKPKIVPKPATVNAQKTESVTKPSGTKLAPKPSNVASLQQKFENRKSFGRDSTTVKK